MCARARRTGLVDAGGQGACRLRPTPTAATSCRPRPRREIGRRLADVSPIRAIAGVRQVSSRSTRSPSPSTGCRHRLGRRDGGTARDRGADAGRAAVPGHGTLCHAGGDARRCSTTSAVNLDQWIAEEVQQAFAEQEGAAFVTGNGVNKPQGLSRLHQGGRRDLDLGQPRLYRHAALPARFPALEPVRQADRPRLCAEERLPPERPLGDEPQDAERPSASSRTPTATISGSRRAGATAVATLMGFPITEAEDMPDIGADASPLAFGDFRRGYLVVDRRRRAGAARSLFRQALRAVLHDQAGGRRRAELRGDQADEVRRLVSRMTRVLATPRRTSLSRSPRQRRICA